MNQAQIKIDKGIVQSFRDCQVKVFNRFVGISLDEAYIAQMKVRGGIVFIRQKNFIVGFVRFVEVFHCGIRIAQINVSVRVHGVKLQGFFKIFNGLVFFSV